MSKRSITIPALPVQQPIGEFYIGVIGSRELIEIAYADIRRIERDLDNYLGIQRKLSPTRNIELARYVNTTDATFPTSIILAIEEECVSWDEKGHQLTLTETKDIPFDELAKILDGQHRIEGLKSLKPEKTFELNVAIFVSADIADQASIFATVNLAQTKVNRSLVYDLFDYATSRSPQKSAHDVAVALDRFEDGPFHKRIKRLGVRTEGRTGETLTQATIVLCLLDLMSPNPMQDRDRLLRREKLKTASDKELHRFPFRNLFIEEEDSDIAKIVSNYFDAIRKQWPQAWESTGKGNILPRTNGFRAFMRAFRPIYVQICGPERIGRVAATPEFSRAFSKLTLRDKDFSTENYAPGTSGETALYKDILEQLKLED